MSAISYEILLILNSNAINPKKMEAFAPVSIVKFV